MNYNWLKEILKENPNQGYIKRADLNRICEQHRDMIFLYESELSDVKAERDLYRNILFKHFGVGENVVHQVIDTKDEPITVSKPMSPGRIRSVLEQKARRKSTESKVGVVFTESEYD